jgi:hypothetical protein
MRVDRGAGGPMNAPELPADWLAARDLALAVFAGTERLPPATLPGFAAFA